jgi:cytochrome b pre-mRNA-processing protein 3
MLGFLFRTLTADPARGADLFSAATAEARQPHWYVEGQVPDSIDGRFAVLATIIALVLVRIEREGSKGDAVSVALTERFIEVMESEHRELGLGDPGLGKTVRKLVGALSRRTDLWRATVAGDRDWGSAARDSLYKEAAAQAALAHSSRALKAFWARLDKAELAAIAQGRLQ